MAQRLASPDQPTARQLSRPWRRMSSNTSAIVDGQVMSFSSVSRRREQPYLLFHRSDKFVLRRVQIESSNQRPTDRGQAEKNETIKSKMFGPSMQSRVEDWDRLAGLWVEQRQTIGFCNVAAWTSKSPIGL